MDVFEQTDEALDHFVNLDDNDLWCSLKVWSKNPDTVLSVMSAALVNRKVFKIEIGSEPVSSGRVDELVETYMKRFSISQHEASYFVLADAVSTNMYNEKDDSIDILYNDGSIKDIAEASDMLNIQLLSKRVQKYYVSYLR
jgi:hypothetical protein